MSTLGIKQIWGLLVPPADASGEALAMWRVGVFLALVMLSVVLGTHIAAVMGRFGDEHAFASRADVHSLVAEVKGMHVRGLVADLLAMRVRQCQALANGNREAAGFAGEALQGLRLDYEQATKRAYPMPTCREVGVAP